MVQKKPINWVAIKKRYLQGEPPVKIAEDYETDAKAIRNKAYRERWISQKETIQDNIVSEVEDDLKALCSATIKVHRKFMERMLTKGQDGQDMIKALEHPFLTDGEKVNSLFQTAMNNSVKVYLAAIKAQDDDPEEANPAGNVHHTNYQRSFSNSSSIRNYASKPIPGLQMASGDSGQAEREDDNGN